MLSYVALRTVEIRRDEVDRALVALSTALSVETLPAEEALPLLEAHHRGIGDLPASFGGWGAVQLEAWAATRSSPTASSAATRFPTRRSFGSSA